MEERICRICLATEKTDKFTRIFKDNLALKIFLICNIKSIESSNNMPALICKYCEIELYQSFNFRKKAQTSQEYFARKLPFLESFFDACTEEQDIIIESIENDETIEEYLEYPDESEIKIEFHAEEVKIKDENECLEEDMPHKKLTCQYCGLKLSRRQRLIQHERLHFLETNKYMCDKCGKNFNQRFGLIPHFQKYHNYKPDRDRELWKCAICPNKILPPGNLEVHYEKIHREFCIQNEIKFYGNLSMSRKSKKKLPRKQSKTAQKTTKIFFPCEICGNSFTSSIRYQKHLKDVHGVEHRSLQNYCAENDRNERAASVSEPHKNIPCSTCGKMFANLNTCKTHEKIHSGLKYDCDLCGSSFSMKSYLTSHVQKVHLKLKRFKCSLCTKTFVHRELLNYHIKKHLNIRNYSCTFCQKTFVRKACVMIHERIHKNERPYSCTYCDRQFIHHSDHRRHESRHTNDISLRSCATKNRN